MASVAPVLSLRDAELTLGGRVLWSGLDLDVAPGEFVAVLGANGSGKTSLLKTVLGQHRLSAGTATLLGEPVPGYLLAALGMHVVTPVAFSRAIENGTDAPAAVLAQTLATLTPGRAQLLVYNVQATGPQTDAVIAAAKKAGIPAVPVSETLPPGFDYVTWQRGVLATIAQALGD